MRGPLRRVREWLDRRRRNRRTGEPAGGLGDDDSGAGVREPRRPRPPHLSGSVALEEPPTEEKG